MRMSREIYENDKSTIKKLLRCSDSELVRLLKMDHDEAVSEIAPKLIEFKGNVMSMENVDIFDSIYYYKRCLHLITGETKVDVSEGLDTTCLENLNNDVILDTMVNDKEVCLRLVRRNFPVVVRGKRYYWTVIAYSDSKELFNASFDCDAKVTRLFLMPNKLCSKCKLCNKTSDDNFIIRPRNKVDCLLEQVGATPLELVAIVINAIERYLSRDKISVTKQRKVTKKDTECIRVASVDLDTDTERVLPLVQYIKEYCPSKPYVYKGGHHKSPVSHPRSGYYRRSKCGDHVLRDGEFVKVPKGMGSYTYVQPTLVNADKDSVLASIL